MEGERIYTTQTYYYWKLLGAFDFSLPFAWNILTCEKRRDKLSAIDCLTASFSLRTSCMKGSNIPGSTNCWTGFVQFPSTEKKDCNTLPQISVENTMNINMQRKKSTPRYKTKLLFCSQKHPFHVYCELITDWKSFTFHPTTQEGKFHRTKSIKEHQKN